MRLLSCIIDGEAVSCDESGIAQFNRIGIGGTVFLYGDSGTGFRVSNFEQICQRLAL